MSSTIFICFDLIKTLTDVLLENLCSRLYDLNFNNMLLLLECDIFYGSLGIAPTILKLDL